MRSGHPTPQNSQAPGITTCTDDYLPLEYQNSAALAPSNTRPQALRVGGAQWPPGDMYHTPRCQGTGFGPGPLLQQPQPLLRQPQPTPHTRTSSPRQHHLRKYAAEPHGHRSASLTKMRAHMHRRASASAAAQSQCTSGPGPPGPMGPPGTMPKIRPAGPKKDTYRDA